MIIGSDGWVDKAVFGISTEASTELIGVVLGCCLNQPHHPSPPTTLHPHHLPNNAQRLNQLDANQSCRIAFQDARTSTYNQTHPKRIPIPALRPNRRLHRQSNRPLKPLLMARHNPRPPRNALRIRHLPPRRGVSGGLPDPPTHYNIHHPCLPSKYR